MERPSLYPDLAFPFEAFFTLSLGRQYNEAGPQPLTYADMVLYLNDKNVPHGDDREEYMMYIRALDSKYIELSHEKMRKSRERLNKQSSSGNKGSRKGR